MEDTTVVLYAGPDADSVAERWNGGDRPFEVAPAVGETASLSDYPRIDCLVVRRTDDDEFADLVAAVHDRSPRIPVVVVRTGLATPAEALAEQVTHFLSVPEGQDPLEVLDELESVVSRSRTRRRELSMLDSLLANIPLSVYVKDRRSRHVRVSDAMLTMVGPDYIENVEGKRHVTPEDIEGKTDFDLYPETLASSSTADDRAVMGSEEAIFGRIEHPYEGPGGGTYVETSKAPWYDDEGRLAGIIGITRDISQRKGYETQLERQNERLSRFATNVSHEIRNPLSVAIGRAQMAKDTGEAEHFDMLDRSLERIESIVDDVLAVTMQAEPVLDPDPVAVGPLAETAWANLPTDGAVLETTAERTILADRGRLRYLLSELFENSLVHGAPGPDGPATLTVTVGDLGDGEEGFFVADDGVGIPPATRESMFEPGLTEGQESGLGLNIVFSVATAHNWTVEVCESEGGGARFEFHGARSPGLNGGPSGEDGGE